MNNNTYCCKNLEDLHEIKGYMSGQETKIPALADKKHLICIWTETLVSTCPAYFPIEFCPSCGSILK